MLQSSSLPGSNIAPTSRSIVSDMQSPSGRLTPSQILFRAAHRARLARIAEAASRVPPPVCKTRDYRPFVTEIVEVERTEPEVAETPEQWAKRQRAIPMPPTAYEPWFYIEAEIEPAEPRRPSVAAIQCAAALHYDITRSDITSARRTADVVRPRQVAMYLAKTLTLCSLPEIGRRFGGRDHTTVLHAVRKIEARIRTDADLAQDVALIELAIAGAP